MDAANGGTGVLSETALAVYRHLVARPAQTADEVSFELGLADEEMGRACQELFGAGLVQATADPGQRFVALPPEIALGRRVYDDERVVRQLRAQIDDRRADYLSLVPHYVAAREVADGYADVQVLEDVATIRDFLADACRNTRTELLIAHPNRHLSANSLREGLPQDLEMLARGVARRNLYLPSNRDSVAVRRAVEKVAAAGAEVRVLPAIPLRVMCFDARVAMLSRGRSADDKAAIVVRDRNLACVVRQAFFAAWEVAEPFFVSEPSPVVDVPSRLEAAILQGLAQGLADEQIARRQNISVRTCRRYIRALTDRLGAQSRFQAGVLAAKRGWA